MGSKGNGSGPEYGQQGGPVGGPEGGVHEVLDIEKEYMNDKKGGKSDSDGSDSEDVDARVAYLQTIIDEIAETRKRLHEERAQRSKEGVFAGVGHDNRENDGVMLSEDEVDSDDDDDSDEKLGVDDGDGGSETEEEEDGNELGHDKGDGPNGSQGNGYFQLGKTYATKKELVDDISTYAIKVGVNVKLTKSEPCRVKAKCELACPFVIYASKDGHNPGLVVKTLHLEHRCGRVFKNPRASVKWLAGVLQEEGSRKAEV